MMIARIVLTIACGLLIAGQAWAFDEGIDYTRLAQPQPTETGNKVEVLEFFWYGCPHCFHLEPLLQKWATNKPANAELRRMPAVLGPNWEPDARAFFAAELLGVQDKLHEPLFRAIHVDKRRIMDEDQLVAFAAEQGINADAFRKAYESFYVNMKVRRAAELERRYGIDGVPSIVVNGKYRTSASQTGSNEKLIEVINYLVKKESGGAGNQAAAAGGQAQPPAATSK
jgi:thiol:disulfide interchange protein DsbA